MRAHPLLTFLWSIHVARFVCPVPLPALPTSRDDIIEWPDGVWYFREEADEIGYPFLYRSDDIRVIPADTAPWYDFLESQQA
jgi:hypothetical protein